MEKLQHDKAPSRCLEADPAHLAPRVIWRRGRSCS
jgi:hypothetical protein